MYSHQIGALELHVAAVRTQIVEKLFIIVDGAYEV